MLDQRKRVELAAQMAQAQAAAAANAPAVSGENMAAAAPGYTDSNATYAQAPLTPPASTVTVIPYPAASYAYYGYYPYAYYGYYPYAYYGPYYGGYYGPSVAFGFAYGCYGGYHGAYHGGYHGGHGSYASGGHHH
jgi:hypothetical protein